MNEQIQQIIETIKTLNLNIDSATFEKVASEVTPQIIKYLYFQKILQFIEGIVVMIGALIFAYLIMKLIKNIKGK